MDQDWRTSTVTVATSRGIDLRQIDAMMKAEKISTGEVRRFLLVFRRALLMLVRFIEEEYEIKD